MDNNELVDLFHSNAALAEAYLKHLKKHPSDESVLLLSILEPFLPIKLSRKLRRIIHPHKQNFSFPIVAPLYKGRLKRFLITSTVKYGLAPQVFKKIFHQEMRIRKNNLQWRATLSGCLLAYLRSRMVLAEDYKRSLLLFLQDSRVRVYSQAVPAYAMLDEIDNLFIRKLRLCIQSNSSYFHGFGLEALYYRLTRKHRIKHVAEAVIEPLIASRTRKDGCEDFRKFLIRKTSKCLKK